MVEPPVLYFNEPSTLQGLRSGVPGKGDVSTLAREIMDQFFVAEDEQVFNNAVAMALEWGENFGKPIQARLMQNYPQLTNEQADDYDRVAREVKYFAIGEFERLYLKQISAPQAFETIRQRYPLLNDENLNHLHNQGQYYAWHDHG